MTSTLDQIARDATDKIQAAYWVACDAAQAAIDPVELTKEVWVEDLLAEAFEIAMRIESDPDGWCEARSKW